MAAQITTLCDALVTQVLAAWNTSISPSSVSSPDSVSWEFLAEIDSDTLTGRKVFLFPGPDYSNGPATRGEDEWVYAVAALVVERYTDAGTPTKDWIKERVEFVQDIVSGSLDFVRSYLDISGREIWTQENTVTVYDPEKLEKQKLFWSEVKFEFREIQPG